jgi:hypothetical protein
VFFGQWRAFATFGKKSPKIYMFSGFERFVLPVPWSLENSNTDQLKMHPVNSSGLAASVQDLFFGQPRAFATFGKNRKKSIFSPITTEALRVVDGQAGHGLH